MYKMTKEDDTEAYIESFERTTIQMELDRILWASQLGSLLVGKALQHTMTFLGIMPTTTTK